MKLVTETSDQNFSYLTVSDNARADIVITSYQTGRRTAIWKKIDIISEAAKGTNIVLRIKGPRNCGMNQEVGTVLTQRNCGLVRLLAVGKG